ncbi:MAG TPA: ABC transporter permease [Gemmatimonadales bacterium]|nr:ABC transporter permease [Gemmatimonadales bacterium]
MTARVPRWLLALTGAVYLFLHLPVIVLMIFSFNDSRFSVDWRGFTLQWYERLLQRSDILHGLKMSLIVGLTATAISVVLGTLIALALARHRLRGKRAAEGLIYLPLVTPEIVVGISLLILFATLDWPLGVATITIAHVVFCISFVVIVLLARLEGMDGSLEEAAMILGADEITAFRRITLPQLRPGILAGALLAFTISFDDFVITSFVSGPGSSTLPVVVYGMVRRTVEPSINAISTIILLVSALLIYFADRSMRPVPRRASNR